MLKMIATVVAILMPMSSLAATSWMPTCALSEDKSALEVIASNPGDTKYYCQAWCRMKISGERALQKFDCSFSLPAKAGEKVMCSKDGGTPGYFSEVLPTKSTCVPR